MKDTEASASKPRGVIAVQQGLVVPPVVLRAMLPEVATVVKSAMSASSTQAESPKAPELQQDAKTHKGTPNTRNILNPFPCNICNLRFPSRNTLNWHLLSHFNQCRHCRACFDSKALLITHKCCRIPKKSYASETTKITHTCKTCKKIFMTRKLLKEHEVCHDPFGPCPKCRRRFPNQPEHKNETKPCNYCKKCIRKENHFAHVLYCIKSGPQLKCSFCGEQFEESFSLMSHVRTHKAPVKSYSRACKVAKLVDTGDGDTQSQTRSDDSNNIETCMKGTANEITNEKCLIELHDVNEKDENIKKHDERQFVKVKEEPSDLKTSDEIDDIKVEPSEFEIISPEARRNLYAGHQIQGEMVLGPVKVQKLDIVYAVQKDLQNKTCCKQEPASDTPNCPNPQFIRLCPFKDEPNEFSFENESIDRKPDLSSIKTEHF